jgi:epsilon-lactone hydrolase
MRELNVELRIAADPFDLPAVAELVNAGLSKADDYVSEGDIARLRQDQPRRFGGPLFRRLAIGAAHQSVEVGGISAEWITFPGASEQRTIIYFHGGAFVRGSLAQGRGIASSLGMAAGARVLALDYRQAPEHRCPAPVVDGLEVYRALLTTGTNPASIVLAGDSCGGAIVVSVLLAIRDRGLRQPAGAISISPWADLTMSGDSWRQNATKDCIGVKLQTSLARIYLGDCDARNPLASPALADLRGLPPMLIVIGANERLYSDAYNLAHAAQKANVQVEMQTYGDMVHVFPMLHLRTADLAIRNAAEFLSHVVG